MSFSAAAASRRAFSDLLGLGRVAPSCSACTRVHNAQRGLQRGSCRVSSVPARLAYARPKYATLTPRPFVCAAVYSIFTSPHHPPVPDHLPTLIVTPNGRPNQVLCERASQESRTEGRGPSFSLLVFVGRC